MISARVTERSLLTRTLQELQENFSESVFRLMGRTIQRILVGARRPSTIRVVLSFIVRTLILVAASGALLGLYFMLQGLYRAAQARLVVSQELRPHDPLAFRTGAHTECRCSI